LVNARKSIKIITLMNTQHHVVLCTCPNQDSARLIADTLVDRDQAACVNIVPNITSVYRWKNKRETSTEVLLIIKSLVDVYPKLQATILELHPYELPEIIALPIGTGLPAYLAWIENEVGQK